MFDGFLDGGFVEMMTAFRLALGVLRAVGSREEVLPLPFFLGVGRFVLNGVWEVDLAEAFGEVLLVNGLDVLKVAVQRSDEGGWKRGDAVSAAFAIANDDLVVGEVYVFDAEAQAFHDAQAATIHELCGEFIDTLQVVDDLSGFFFGEDSGDFFSALGAKFCELGFV